MQDVAIVLITVGGAFMIPIVSMLIKHQQRMTELLRTNSPNLQADPNIGRLAGEVQELRSLVTQQAIVLDNLAETQRRLLAKIEEPSISERLNA